MKNSPPEKRRPPLFALFPKIEAKLGWTPLVETPTPVHRLKNISALLKGEVWVKRDDKSSSTYGGNKPRKLEFILGDALTQEKNIIITGGGLGTNHGLATAVFARKLGFQVRLGLFDQPVTEHVKKNLLLCYAHGAEMRYLGSMLNAVAHYYVFERIRQRRAYFVDPGGSSPVGVLGFVDAGLELARQIEQEILPIPKVIYVSLGTCGTVAGLVLGLRLAGLSIKVLGIQVAPRPIANSKATLGLARKTLRLMRGLDTSVQEVKLELSDFPVDEGQYGSGYGHLTSTGQEAMALMGERETIYLDPTYTAKTFAATIEHFRSGKVQGPALFWNTLNSVDLSSIERKVDYKSLPKSFHNFFERK
jgi:D-cysteine desulfhydrase